MRVTTPASLACASVAAPLSTGIMPVAAAPVTAVKPARSARGG